MVSNNKEEPKTDSWSIKIKYPRPKVQTRLVERDDVLIFLRGI